MPRPDALTSLQAKLDAAPQDAALHQAMAALQRERGDELAALAHQLAAHVLGAGDAAAAVQPLNDIATGYFMKGDYPAAERWYRLLLSLQPELACAYQNLAAIHQHFGREDAAQACRRQAYQLQRVFIEPVAKPLRRLLILCAGHTAGNIPFETLLSHGSSLRIKYAIDCADPSEDAALPPYDLIFNAIGEPDAAAPLLPRLQSFIAAHPQPLLNAPERVVATQRHKLPQLLRGLRGVATAACLRLEDGEWSDAALQAQLDASSVRFPLLARPIASHGGEGLQRCEDLPALQSLLRAETGSRYLCSQRDYRSGDGYYRKYRMIFVDRRPLPYHLAISPHWMVHYYTADMEGHDWKIEEERRFLQDPLQVLGEPAIAALHAIGRRLDLDYAGIDFGVLPDGRLLVFEANPTMLVHRLRDNGPLTHKNRHVQDIADAFEKLQRDKLSPLSS